ncbi:hypothetical protein RQP46_006555 [Phenoliferia psychrophenolica]
MSSDGSDDPADLLVADSRKHQLDLDINSSLQQSIQAEHSRPKRQRTNNDISVLEDAGMDSASNDGDNSDEDSGDEYIDIDPVLKSSTSTSNPRQPLRSPPAAFAHNTGNFLALSAQPDGSLDSEQPLLRANSNPLDYTHISQALAHQPLATNASQQTVSLMQKLATAGGVGTTTEERLGAFMREVQNQMFALSQRVDVVETARFAAQQNVANLQTSFTALQSFLGPSPSASDLNTSADALAIPTQPTHANPVSDEANGQAAASFAAHVSRHYAEIARSNGNTDHGLPPDFASSLALSGGFNIPTGLDDMQVSPTLQHPIASSSTSNSKPRGSKSKRSASTSGKANSADAKPGPRKRKPELSRAVRATMFKLLNLPLANGSTKYHGYTSQPELPDFSEAPIFDTTTGVRSWRWEWEKTIRQSQANAAFSTAIQNQVLADKAAGLITDVPEGDWADVEGAVEAAYTNLRRERDSQVNPAKKVKKDEHRKRGKKRGLKEEKRVRRLGAYADGTQDGSLVDPREDGASQTWTNLLSTFTDEGDDLAEALDIRYMSSEEEVDTNDPSVLDREVADIDVLGPSTLTLGEKAFYVHRPAWRSDRLQKAYAELDALKPAEKAYRRILGEPRAEYPPEGTPSWMISDVWSANLIEKGGIMRHQRSGKGKGKMDH